MSELATLHYKALKNIGHGYTQMNTDKKDLLSV
jgi:hypothetical protein